jgi:hypothetical protein
MTKRSGGVDFAVVIVRLVALPTGVGAVGTGRSATLMLLPSAKVGENRRLRAFDA